jgi:anti-sigma factor (TIGR02949 family)
MARDASVTCRDLTSQLDAYLDGELAAAETGEVESHLRACADCTRERERQLALRAAVRAELSPLSAPDGLRARIRDALRTQHRERRPSRAARWSALGLAASAAAIATGAWELATRRAAVQNLTEQLVASHVRSLMPGHLTDVVSSDQHTVKPWFNGRLDFSPPVYDFAGLGFPLIGGRLDYVGGRPVAVLVYGRRQHVIDVYVWPAAPGPTAGPRAGTRQGYHLVHWTGPEFVYWVVSDLGMPELDPFAERLRQGETAAGRHPEGL